MNAEKSPWNSSQKAMVSNDKIKENNPGSSQCIPQYGCSFYE
jgi:hypothetical protein